MITDLVQRRVPKRKDRFNLSYIFYGIVLVLPFLDIFFPSFGLLAGDLAFITYILIIMIVSLGVSIFQWRAWHITWRKFAADLGLTCLTYKPKGFTILQWPRIEGIFHGNSLSIKRFTKGSGRYKKIYTSIWIGLREPISESLEITPRRWSSGIKMSLVQRNSEFQYVEVNDDVVDRKLIIKSTAEHFARNSISAQGLKQGLVEIAPQARNMLISIRGKELKYQERSNIMDRDYLLSLLDVLTELAGYAERYG